MSPVLDFFASTRDEEGSSARTSAKTILALEGPEVRKEPPQDVEEPMIENLTKGSEVHKESPQIDNSSCGKCTYMAQKLL